MNLIYPQFVQLYIFGIACVIHLHWLIYKPLTLADIQTPYTGWYTNRVWWHR